MKKIIVSGILFSFFSAFCLLSGQGTSVKVSMAGDTVAYGSSAAFELLFENGGDTDISNLTYAFCVGNGGIDSLNVQFVTGLKPQKSSEKEIVFSMKDVELGQNILSMWCVKENDMTIDSKHYDTVRLEFTYLDSTLVSPFYPLLEMFSSSNCSNCAPLNKGVSDGVEELVGLNLLNVVKYQINAPVADPYATASGNNRMSYYGVTGAPTSIYCGTENFISWGPYPEFENMLSNLRYKVYAESGSLRLMNINLVDFTIDTVDHYLNLEFNVGSMQDMSVLVNAVVVEKTTYENAAGNGETEFHWITMDIPTNIGKGLTLNLKKGEVTDNFHYQVALSNTHTEEDSDLQVVFIIQNTTNKAVYQSLRFRPEFGDVEYDPSLSVEAPRASVDFELYPNPVTDKLYIGGLPISSELSVFDLSGRCLWRSKTNEEGMTLTVSDYVPGIYFLRVVQDGKIGVRRFSVVR